MTELIPKSSSPGRPRGTKSLPDCAAYVKVCYVEQSIPRHFISIHDPAFSFRQFRGPRGEASGEPGRGPVAKAGRE